MSADMTPTRFGTIERTPDGGLIRYDRRLGFPIEEVWSAITEPARLADWWPPFAAEVAVDLRVGGLISFPWPDGDETQTLTFTILRLEPPTLLEHTHTSPGSWMRYELEPLADGAGTRLLATYFVPDPASRSNAVTSSAPTTAWTASKPRSPGARSRWTWRFSPNCMPRTRNSTSPRPRVDTIRRARERSL